MPLNQHPPTTIQDTTNTLKQKPLSSYYRYVRAAGTLEFPKAPFWSSLGDPTDRPGFGVDDDALHLGVRIHPALRRHWMGP